MKTVTGKLKAWIAPTSFANPESVLKGDLVGVSFLKTDMSAYGYTYVGEAEISLQLIDAGEMIDNKVAALRAEAANIRAEATAKVTRIEGQIQQLLAIEYQPSEVSQ